MLVGDPPEGLPGAVPKPQRRAIDSSGSGSSASARQDADLLGEPALQLRGLIRAPREAARRAAAWSPYRSYAASYRWRLANLPEA